MVGVPSKAIESESHCMYNMLVSSPVDGTIKGMRRPELEELLQSDFVSKVQGNDSRLCGPTYRRCSIYSSGWFIYYHSGVAIIKL